MAKKRKRGDGSVHLRKDGRWEGRVVIGYDDNGSPKTKNVLAKNKKACLQKLKALKDSLKKVEAERLSSDMSFGAWLDHWYQNQCKPAIGPKTQTDYENRIYRHIIPDPAGQAHRKGPSAVLPPTQAGRPPPSCGPIWSRTL